MTDTEFNTLALNANTKWLIISTVIAIGIVNSN